MDQGIQQEVLLKTEVNSEIWPKRQKGEIKFILKFKTHGFPDIELTVDDELPFFDFWTLSTNLIKSKYIFRKICYEYTKIKEGKTRQVRIENVFIQMQQCLFIFFSKHSQYNKNNKYNTLELEVSSKWFSPAPGNTLHTFFFLKNYENVITWCNIKKHFVDNFAEVKEPIFQSVYEKPIEIKERDKLLIIADEHSMEAVCLGEASKSSYIFLFANEKDPRVIELVNLYGKEKILNVNNKVIYKLLHFEILNDLH